MGTAKGLFRRGDNATLRLDLLAFGISFPGCLKDKSYESLTMRKRLIAFYIIIKFVVVLLWLLARNMGLGMRME